MSKPFSAYLVFALLIPLCSFAQGSSLSNKSRTEIESILKFDGYLMLDHDYYGPFYNKDENSYRHATEIRRSKIALTLEPSKYVKTKFQLKYSKKLEDKGELSLGDAFIHLKMPLNTALQVGRMKEPFGLEQQTSSADLLLIERSIITESFAPGRSFGFQFNHKQKNYTFTAGHYLERDTDHNFALSNFNLFEYDSNYDTKAMTARLTFAPILQRQSTLHLGTSFSQRNFAGKKVQIKERGEVNNADKIIQSARFYADDSTLYQADIAWSNPTTLIQAELYSSRNQQTQGHKWLYSGAYVQASYHFSGYYKYKNGRFKPSKSSEKGSTEIVLRQSAINLRDHNVGSESSFTSFGINYYPYKNTKIMFNMIVPQIWGDTINDNQSGNAYSMRLQVTF